MTGETGARLRIASKMTAEVFPEKGCRPVAYPSPGTGGAGVRGATGARKGIDQEGGQVVCQDGMVRRPRLRPRPDEQKQCGAVTAWVLSFLCGRKRPGDLPPGRPT